MKSLITHHKTKGVFVLLVLLVLKLSAQVPSAIQNNAAIVEAIEDEIYDYGLQADYQDIGTATAKNIRHVNLYVFPNSKQPGSFNVIYKLPPPYGEIYRMVRINDDGLAFLYTRPEHGFRSSGPAFSTVYLDDDQVCKLKTEATKTYFEVQVEPAKDRLQQAIARQKRRYGHSAFEETRVGKPARVGLIGKAGRIGKTKIRFNVLSGGMGVRFRKVLGQRSPQPDAQNFALKEIPAVSLLEGDEQTECTCKVGDCARR